MRFFLVDSFTSEAFAGNPAAVILAESWPAVERLQKIAAETNQPATTFVVKAGDSYGLRWFSPTSEISLCGHGTLAAGFVLFDSGEIDGDEIWFDSVSAGRLGCRRTGHEIELDFPAIGAVVVPEPQGIAEALGVEPVEFLASDDERLLVVLTDEAHVGALQPDLNRLRQLTDWIIYVAAPGAATDIVSRVFYQMTEDQVTGSAHCMIGPYWADRFDRTELTARQLSPRGGELGVTVDGARVQLRGRAMMVAFGYMSAGLASGD